MIHRILHRGISSRANIERERLLSLINSMADGVVAVDSGMHVIMANGAAQNILDLNSTLVGKRLNTVFHPVDANKQPVDIESMIKQVKLPYTNRDLRLAYSDGSVSNIFMSISPVHLGYGKRGLHGYVTLLRDITREKSLEEERDEFISVVSHELRTPIAITEGNISNAQFIAERTGDIEQVKAALQQAHDQTVFLANMVNDLATLSRAQRGKLVVEVAPIDVQQFTTTLVDSYRKDAEAKNLGIELRLSDMPQTLYSSELYVQEILQNFITNAIKYSESGMVVVSAEPKDKGILFTVQDNGIGISKSDQERVFDKFFRSEDFRTRKNNGTGLGLYVTVKLARLLNADIDLKSELNKGSTFSIYVPNLKA